MLFSHQYLSDHSPSVPGPILFSEWVVGMLNWEVERMIIAVHSEDSEGVEEYQVGPEVHPVAFYFWIEKITTDR